LVHHLLFLKHKKESDWQLAIVTFFNVTPP
jgi:hypothetical protein